MKENKQNTQEATTLDENQVYSFLELDDVNKCSVVKNDNVCMVIHAQNCFYKVRKQNTEDAKSFFEQVVLNAFVSEYKQLGLEWDMFNVRDGEDVYTVEKRPILEVLTPSTFSSFDDVLAKTSDIYRRVENRLEFPVLTAQISQEEQFRSVEKVSLARNCKNDFADYALWQNHVIPLGNSNFFLALLNHNNMYDCCHKSFSSPISLTYGDFYFDNYYFFKNSKTMGRALRKRLSSVIKWWLFPSDVADLNEVNNYLDNELKDMYTTNLEILTSKQLHTVKTVDDFDSAFKECRKLN